MLNTPAAAIERTPSCVLVVDNDQAVLAAMVELLSGWGCRVLSAVDASSAMQQLETRRPDLMIVDFHLDNDATGLDLRASLPTALKDIPCIVVSADHSAGVRDAVEKAGCQLLYKPLKPLALRSLLGRLTG